MTREQEIDRVVRFALWSLWPSLPRATAAQLLRHNAISLRRLQNATLRFWRDQMAKRA